MVGPYKLFGGLSLKVLIPLGSRAEWGLSAPIIRKLGEDPYFETINFQLEVGKFGESYALTEKWIIAIQPDMAVIVADRIEMTGAAAACYHNNVPFAHYFAGILNNPIVTLDDINRHCITLWSTIQLCESFECAENVRRLFKPINKIPQPYTVGITHLEDIALDDECVPNGEYYLVLYNPITSYSKDKNEDIMRYEIEEIKTLCGDFQTIFIYPNKDPGTDYIFAELNAMATENENYTLYFHNLPRPQFLALLDTCSKFFSNSSSTIYEAPFFLKKKQIVHIGKRNINRTNAPTTRNGSTEIYEVLKNWRMK